MNEIDWSKAPEWATKHGISGASKSPVWFDDKKYTYVDGQQGGKEFFYADACTYVAKDFSQVSERPTTPSWSGEGLPPVGAVCEYMAADNLWIECEVVAHRNNAAIVIDNGYDCALVPALELRPIRTPEQIAADEREAAIDEMLAATPAPGSDISLRVCEQLYDAGYRKP